MAGLKTILAKAATLGLAIAVLLAVAVPSGFASGYARYGWMSTYKGPLEVVNYSDSQTVLSSGKKDYYMPQRCTYFTGNVMNLDNNTIYYFYGNNSELIKPSFNYNLNSSGYYYNIYGPFVVPSNTTNGTFQVFLSDKYKNYIGYYGLYTITEYNILPIDTSSLSGLDGSWKTFEFDRTYKKFYFCVQRVINNSDQINGFSIIPNTDVTINVSTGDLPDPTLPTLPPSPTDPPPETSVYPDATWVTADQFQTFADYQNTVLHYISLVDASISVLLQDELIPKLNIMELALSSISGFLLDDVKPGIESLNNTLTEINNKLDSLPSGGSTDLTNIENQLDELIDTQATEQERQMSEGAESLRDGYNAIFTENENPIDSKDFMGLGIIAHFFDSFGNGSQLNPVTQAFSGDWWNIWDNLEKSFEEASNYVYDPGG